MQLKKMLVGFGVVGVVVGGFAVVAEASHSWGGYHWARATAPLVLTVGDNVTTAWDSYLVSALGDWNTSIALDTVLAVGKTRPRTCGAVTGRVEVCNAKYGSTGWLGVAQVWVSGGHITKGTVKMNDTYFSLATYNTPEWKNLVMCQELGHTLGLDHQDEIFDNANLDTCMDYTNNPSTNQHPNQHDYDELESIYAHSDGATTTLARVARAPQGTRGELADGDADDVREWGRVVRKDSHNRNTLHLRDLGKGEQVFTFVTWVK